MQAVGVQDRSKGAHARKVTAKWVKVVLAFLLFLFFMAPFLLVVMNSAKTAVEISLSPVAMPENWGQMGTNISNTIGNPHFSYWSAFRDSFIITFFSLAVIVLASAMCTWVLVRNKKWWSTTIFMILVASMVIPFQVVMLPLVQWLRMLLCYLGFGMALSVFIFHGFIKSIPLELEEAADIDGCSRAGIFFRIVLPLLQPTAVTVLILNGIWIWNDYLLPLLVLGSSGSVQTLPLAVSKFAGSYIKQWDLLLTSTLLAMLPVIILFLFAQKYIIKGMVEGSIK